VGTELIRGLYNLTPSVKGCVVTIGNFDGVHRGHQALLAQVKEKANINNLTSVVVVFEPQPAEFFASDQITVPRLTRCREKYFALAETGIDQVIVLRFDKTLAALTAEEFVQQILVSGLNAKHVIVGDDFRFGKSRQGDFHELQAQGKKYHFSVESMPSLMMAGERVSSTRVRQALANKNHDLVEQLLGRPYSMKGRVMHGYKRGRQLGFPTANIYLHREVTPVQGVYVVRMHGVSSQGLPGVANVGIRPTVGGTRTLLEVHLFDFDQDIYGRQVCVEFCEKIRDEKRYDNLDLLKEQIVKDAAIYPAPIFR